MTKCFCFAITIMMACLSLSSFGNVCGFFKKSFKSIFDTYKKILQQQRKIVIGLMFVATLVIVILLGVISYQESAVLCKNDYLVVRVIISLSVWIATLFMMYMVTGFFLQIFCSVLEFILNIDNCLINKKLLCSFLFSFLLILFSTAFEKDMSRCSLCLLIGGAICYMLDMQILVTIIKNPFCLGDVKEKYTRRHMMVYASILMVIQIVMSLYILVLWSYYTSTDAYFCEQEISRWNLLYYTFISFTTLGYGDIYPKTVGGQAVAILISISSVICLIIFISSVLSAKNDNS